MSKNQENKPTVVSGGGAKGAWERASDLEGHNHYLVKETDEYRYRAIFTFLPILLNKKLRWFKKVIVREQKYMVKKESLDMWGVPGWTSPYEEWRKEDVISWNDADSEMKKSITNEDTYKDEKNAGWATIGLISILGIMITILLIVTN